MGDEFANPFGFTSSRDRFKGYERALARPRTDARRRLRRPGRPRTLRGARPVGPDAALDDRPTAIFAASDTQALGVLAAAQDLGLHVPDDLSVIGYDDIEACDFVGLTTVRQQLVRIGPSGRRAAHRGDRRAAATPPVVMTPRDRRTTDDGVPEGGQPPAVTDRTLSHRRTDPGGGLTCSAPTLTGRRPVAEPVAVPASS